MPDQKPPRLAAGERETLVALLQFQRDSFLRKTDDLDDDAARWSPVASGTSLLWLTNHVADPERIWVLHRLAGRRPGDDPPPADALAAARDRYRDTWAVTDAVLALISLGYKQVEAHKAVQKALANAGTAGATLSVEELVRQALKLMI